MECIFCISPNACPCTQHGRPHPFTRRFSLVPGEDGLVRASHPSLDSLAKWMDKSPDMHSHEGVFVWVSPLTGVLQSAAVHRTRRGQAAGGVRWWTYDTVASFLTDGLRLARGMTHKNALAGLWWGGGKGVMAKGTGRDPAAAAGAAGDDVAAAVATHRKDVYAEYGRLVSSLQGVYVIAPCVLYLRTATNSISATRDLRITVPHWQGLFIEAAQ
jgi:hypothetical protein